MGEAGVATEGKNALFERIGKNLNYASVVDILVSGPTRWAMVALTAYGHIFPYDKRVNSMFVKLMEKRSVDLARKAGLEVFPPQTVKVEGIPTKVLVSKLPKVSNALLSYQPGPIAGQDFYYARQGVASLKPPEGQYIIMHTPTTEYDERLLANVFNNGLIKVGDNNEVIALGRDIQSFKGGIGIEYTNGKTGPLKIYSPVEIQQIKDGSDKDFRSGVILGTPLYFEIEPGEKTANILQKAAGVMKVNKYLGGVNSRFGFLIQGKNGLRHAVAAMEGDHRDILKLDMKKYLDSYQFDNAGYEDLTFKTLVLVVNSIIELFKDTDETLRVVSMEEQWGADIEKGLVGMDGKAAFGYMRSDGPEILIPISGANPR